GHGCGREEVRREVRPRLHPPRRREPRGGRPLRGLGREEDVRQDLHGRAAGDLHHRPGWQGRSRDPEGLAEDARRRRARGPRAARLNASAPFSNDRYDEDAYAEAEGVELSRVHISRTFTGDLEGESTAELMIARSEGGGGYIGHDRISGTLAGRAGTFVFQHTGIMGPDGVTNTGTI